MISLIFYWRPTPLKSVTMATRNALFPIFEFQNFTNTYLGKVTKFQFNCFSRLGAAFKKPEGAASAPPPVRLGLTLFEICFLEQSVIPPPPPPPPPPPHHNFVVIAPMIMKFCTVTSLMFSTQWQQKSFDVTTIT